MFENIMKFLNKFNKKQNNKPANSREAAKERLHLVLMQDRANVSADFLELMKQEIIEVIKKYIDVDESAIDVRLTNKENEDGTNGAPALYANIPIINIKNEARKIENTKKEEKQIEKQNSKTEEQEKKEDKKQEEKQDKQENKKEIKEQTKKENQEKEEDKNQKEEQLEKQPKEKEEQNEEKITQIKENKEKGSKKESAKEEIKSKK